MTDTGAILNQPGIAYLQVGLPLPKNVPLFDGNNVTFFLDRFSSIHLLSKIEDKSIWLQRLSLYCDDKISRSVEMLIKTKRHDWKKITKVLKKNYRAYDKLQQIYTR